MQVPFHFLLAEYIEICQIFDETDYGPVFANVVFNRKNI